MLTVVCVLVLLAVAFYANRKVEKAIAEMRAETSAREAALNKQAKVFVRDLARSKRAADKTIDQSRAAVDEARSINQQMHEFFRDPRVQRFLDN